MFWPPERRLPKFGIGRVENDAIKICPVQPAYGAYEPDVGPLNLRVDPHTNIIQRCDSS